jgi:hypothetical protein
MPRLDKSHWLASGAVFFIARTLSGKCQTWRPSVLSVRRCRELLGQNCTKTDSEIERMRDQLMAIADMSLDAVRDKKLNFMSDQEQMEIDERVAIMECDGGMRRAEAEHKAQKLWLKEKLNHTRTRIN